MPATEAALQPAEMEVDDRANVIVALSWSPDGQTLLVTTAGGTAGQGRVDLLDLGGTVRTSLPAEAAAWIDGDHLMTLEVSPADPSSLIMVARIHDLASGGAADVQGDYSALLGNGHGSVVMTVAPRPSEAQPLTAVWSDGGLDPAPMAAIPVAWSPDGSLLALEAQPNVALASTGSPQAMRVVVVQVPGWRRVFDSVGVNVDGRLPVWFSPDGWFLAGAAVDGGAVVFDLVDARTSSVASFVPFGWAPEGSLILVDNGGQVRLRDSSGALARPELPAGLPRYGPGGRLPSSGRVPTSLPAASSLGGAEDGMSRLRSRRARARHSRGRLTGRPSLLPAGRPTPSVRWTAWFA